MTRMIGRNPSDEQRNRAMGAGVVDDPYPEFARLREEAELHDGSVSEHFGLPPINTEHPVTAYSHAACTDILRDANSFSSRWYDAGLNNIIGPTMIGMDDPEHRRMRVLLQPAFSRREMQWWTPTYIRPVVDEQLRRVAPLGACDLYQEVGSTVPILTMAAAIGLPEGDRDFFFDSAVRMTSSVVPGEERLAVAAALGEYITPMVTARRADPSGRDLLCALVRARISDEDAGAAAATGDRALTDEEIAAFVRLLIIAGAGTTFRAYGNLFFQLLTHPDQLAAVRADRSLVPQAIEESLRIEQPITVWGRNTVKDTEVGGDTVAAGCPVNVSVGSANHDPRRFPDPERFDIRRANADRHLTFGFGIHRCLGIHLARAELSVLTNRTLDVLQDLRFAPDADAGMTGLLFRMPTGLPVSYTPTKL